MSTNKTNLASFVINHVDSYETYQKIKDENLLMNNQLYIVEDSDSVRAYDNMPRANSQNIPLSGGVYDFVLQEVGKIEGETSSSVMDHNTDEDAHQDIRQEVEANRVWCHTHTETKSTSFIKDIGLPTKESQGWALFESYGTAGSLYKLTLNVPDIEENDNPIIGLNLNGKGLNDINKMEEAWSKIKKVETIDNNLIFYSTSKNLTSESITEIPLQVHVVRSGGNANG